MADSIHKVPNADHSGLVFPAVAQLVLKDTAQNSAAIPIPANANTLLVKSTYDANDTTAPVRIIYVDHAGVETMTAAITPGNTTVSAGGGRFHGELIAIPSYGAKEFKIRLDGVPSGAGDMSLFGKAV
ncbi:MAG: hypothetical protein KAR06_04330 [Deltaproteobacteria bacterium]|nr:hypothetical protein [Deltaproteobacteria bacterium]